jgi:predicted small lipoprotein YifL
MKMKTKAVFAALLTVLLLQGCGLKGDLYLSEDEKSSPPAAAATTTEPATDSDSEDRKTEKQETTGSD